MVNRWNTWKSSPTIGLSNNSILTLRSLQTNALLLNPKVREYGSLYHVLMIVKVGVIWYWDYQCLHTVRNGHLKEYGLPPIIKDIQWYYPCIMVDLEEWRDRKWLRCKGNKEGEEEYTQVFGNPINYLSWEAKIYCFIRMWCHDTWAGYNRPSYIVLLECDVMTLEPVTIGQAKRDIMWKGH